MASAAGTRRSEVVEHISASVWTLEVIFRVDVFLGVRAERLIKSSQFGNVLCVLMNYVPNPRPIFSALPKIAFSGRAFPAYLIYEVLVAEDSVQEHA